MRGPLRGQPIEEALNRRAAENQAARRCFEGLAPFGGLAEPARVVEHRESARGFQRERREALPAHARQQPAAVGHVRLDGGTERLGKLRVEHRSLDAELFGERRQRAARSDSARPSM